MPRKRIASKARQKDDVLSDPDGWLVFWLGWSYNEDPPNREPFFKSLEDMETYYWENRERVLAEVSTESWAWHKFEDHDRAHCETCQRFEMDDSD